jgi:uncharacterized protein
MTSFRPLLFAAALACVATPLAAQSFSVGYTFIKAVRARDGAAAETALASPGSTVINYRDPESGEGALHILVRGRDINWLTYMLGRGARPDIQDSEGNTPLALAAQIGWIEGAEQLIARRATIDAANRRGETPLILAVQGRHPEMVELLAARGADPNLTDNIAGFSALDYARRETRDPILLRILEAARPARGQQQEVAGPPR